MAATLSTMSRTFYKRKCLPESCPGFGETSEDLLPLKRLRLDENQVPSSNVVGVSLTQYFAGSSQPTTPPSSASLPAGFPVRGQPAMSPQQKLPTIPEIHPEFEEINMACRQSIPSTHHLNAVCSSSQPLEQKPAPCAQQQWQHSTWWRATPDGCAAQSGMRYPDAAGDTSGLNDVSCRRGAAPLREDSMEAEEGEPLDVSLGPRCPPADGIPLAVQLQGVRDGGHRLLIPEHLTLIPSGISHLGGVPLDRSSAPSVGDSLAVVPYVPPKEMVEEAYRRMLFQQPPPSPMEHWSRQSGLKFDNQHPLQEYGSAKSSVERRDVVIQELDEEVEAGTDAGESDAPTAMEE